MSWTMKTRSFCALLICLLLLHEAEGLEDTAASRERSSSSRKAGDRLVLTLRGHERDVTSVAFSRDGTRIVSGSEDNTVKVWDARSGKALLTLRGHTDNVISVAFSPDDKRVVSGSKGILKVWDVR